MFNNIKRPTGFRAFLVMWLGQMLSLVGTMMTHFALLIWMWDNTGQATTVAVYMFFGWILFLVMTPLAGVVTDRFDRRLILVLSDLAAALITVAFIALHAAGKLAIWHVYLGEMLVGGFEAFQLSARMAVITVLVPKEHYGRASGMRSFAWHASKVIGPAIAAPLLPLLGLRGIMAIDLATFLVAAGSLALIVVPALAPITGAPAKKPSVWQEVRFGVTYLIRRRGLLMLALLWMLVNMLASFTYFSLLSPMVLARSGGSEAALALVQSVMGIGGVVGAILMTAWGGPKRKMDLVLIGLALTFMLGDIVIGVGRSVAFWAVGGFMAAAFIPLLVSGADAIWQAKVPPGVQGRVFSMRYWLSELAMPVGYLLTGPLADRVFEPAMQASGPLAPVFGGLVGVGPGAGMGLMFVITGLLGTVMGLGGYLFPALHRLEDHLPDHDGLPAAT